MGGQYDNRSNSCDCSGGLRGDGHDYASRGRETESRRSHHARRFPHWVPVCGIVMGSGPDTYVLSGALVPSVPLYTPVTVRGRKTDNNNFCGGTKFEVKAVRRSQKSCVWR